MSITARRVRHAAATGLTLAAVAGASAFAPPAQAGIVEPTITPVTTVGMKMAGPADLVVSRTTPTTVRVANTGLSPAGSFSVSVSKGRIGECDVPVPALTKRVSGLAVGGAVTLTVPASSYDRAVAVDYLNEVAEGNEVNNTGIVPYTTIVC